MPNFYKYDAKQREYQTNYLNPLGDRNARDDPGLLNFTLITGTIIAMSTLLFCGPSFAQTLGSFKKSEVCYGISAKTSNPSDMLPNVTLYRGEKNSTEFLLDNDKENFVTGKEDYFMVSADTINNIGIPNKIKFAAGGNHSNDGWEFDELKVDVFAGKDWNMEAMLKAMKLKNLNSRDAVLNTDLGGVFVKDALIATIEFPGHHGIDGDKEHGQNNQKMSDTLEIDLPPVTIQIAGGGVDGDLHEHPLGTIQSIELVNGSNKWIDKLSNESQVRLMDANSRTDESSYSFTESLNLQFAAGADGIAKKAVDIGFSSTQAWATAETITRETEKTKKIFQSQITEKTNPTLQEGEVVFVIKESVALIASPAFVTVGDRKIRFEEMRVLGRVRFSEPYKIGSAKLRTKWAEYKEKYASLLSDIEYDMYVNPR